MPDKSIGSIYHGGHSVTVYFNGGADKQAWRQARAGDTRCVSVIILSLPVTEAEILMIAGTWLG